MQDTFPNVAMLLRTYVVLMVTNCSAEPVSLHCQNSS